MAERVELVDASGGIVIAVSPERAEILRGRGWRDTTPSPVAEEVTPKSPARKRATK